MNKKFQELDIIFSFVFVIIITLFLIILSIVIFKIPALLTNEFNNDWIGFYGSLFGGLISGFATYIGVLLTIKKNIEDSQEEKRLSLLPYINVSEKYKTGKVDNFLEIVIPIKGNKKKLETLKDAYKIRLELRNIGLGTAIDIKFESETLAINIDKLTLGNNNENSNYNINLAKDDSYFILANIYNITDSSNHLIKIIYKDMLGNIYNQKLKVLMVKKGVKREFEVISLTSPECKNKK